MATLLHCGKRRHAYRRTDIHAPRAWVEYRSQKFFADDWFEWISIYEFHCPGCLKSKGMQEVFGWVGMYYNRTLGKTELQKIAPKDLQRWLDWREQYKIVENRDGALTVQGSLPCFPFTFRSNIRVV